MPVAHADDAPGDAARAVVHREPCAVRDRLRAPRARPRAGRSGEGAGGDERVAAARGRCRSRPGRLDRHALPRLGPLDRGVVHLDGPDPDVAAGGLQPQLVAVADRPRPERPRRDGADAPQREDPVDVEPGREVGPALLDLVRRPRRARRGARRGPSPVTPLTGDDRASGTSSRASSTASSSVSSSTASALVTATTPRSTPSRRRIARCSCVCGRAPSAASSTSRKRSIPVAPATIVRTNRSWPGTSTSESVRPPGSASGA